jgi:hypothetical protein
LLKVLSAVIPGRAEGVSPESFHVISLMFRIPDRRYPASE